MKTTSSFLFFLGLLALLKFFAQKQTPLLKGQAIQVPPSLVAVTQNLRGESSPDIPEAMRQRVMVGYSNLPLSFEANQGQTDAQVKFFSRGQGYDVYLTSTEAVLSFIAAERKSKGKNRSSIERRVLSEEITTNVLRMRLVGANATPQISGLERLTNRSNYFTGNDPSKWQTDVPNYSAVQYKDVYPGVDLIYYGNHGELEYDWVVAPGADPKFINFVIEGAEKTILDAKGDLLVETGCSEARMRKPVVYQLEESPQELGEARKDRENARPEGVERKHFLDGRYVLKGTHAVAFEVSAYDSSRPLIIDPVLSYSSYLGGSNNDQGNGIAVDSIGNAYVTGSTSSGDFPTTAGTFQRTASGAFVTKLNPGASGATSVMYSTYFGPASTGGIAVDPMGNAYVIGFTASTTFPTTPGAFQTVCTGSPCFDAFVTKFNPTGSALVYSTYLGGSGLDQANGIAVDPAGSAYVTGFTHSVDFPTTSGAFQMTLNGSADAFVTKLNASGSALLYSTHLGGASASSIAVDSTGNVYITGGASTNFPTTPGAFQRTPNGGQNAFVAKFNPAASGPASLVYSTYLGGSGGDAGSGITVDSGGNVYVTGGTSSTDFPTIPGAFQRMLNGGQNAFVTKLNTTGSAMVYSTLLGGGTTLSDRAQGNAIAVDSGGNVDVIGPTSSSNFPVTADALRSTSHGGNDTFVTKLNSVGSSLIFSTFFGGTNANLGNGIGLDSTGDAYVTGWTQSPDFPTTSGAFQPTCASCVPISLTPQDASVSKISFAAAGTDFWITAFPNIFTSIVNGGPSAITLSVTPSNGFNQVVALTCSGQPSASTCTISPASMTLNGTSSSTATVTITTTSRSMLLPRPNLFSPGTIVRIKWLWILLFLVPTVPAVLMAARRRFWVTMGATVVLATLCVACGGGGSGGGSSTGTPPGNYTIKLTATSANLIHSTTVTLNVL